MSDKKKQLGRKHNYVFETPRYEESRITAFKSVLEKKLNIEMTEFQLDEEIAP